MNILDRMLFISFVRAYMICLTSTLSLYIIVDMFTNLDDFGSKADGFIDILWNIWSYYSYRVLQYYDRLCEAIALLAAMFTIAWMQRSNELLPMLSAGVSTHRVIRPILLGAVSALTLGVLNQELVIPKIAHILLQERDDPHNEKEKVIQGCYDPNGVHVEGVVGYPKDMSVKWLHVTLPESDASAMAHLSAQSARYVPPGNDRLSGGWLLTNTTPEILDPAHMPPMVERLDLGRYFVHTREVSFDVVTRDPKWFLYTSSHNLYVMLNKPDALRQPQIAVIYHMKITRPIIGMLLVVMGMAIIMRDQTRHVFISAGLCLVMCAVFYGVIFACKFLGNADYMAPALAAWLPVIIFGPFGLALFDAIHT
jgi:lipopolysaccharide export system permease protein